MYPNRLAAGALGALGAAGAIPIALAQLDYAGWINVFGVDAGDSRHALIVFVGTSGIATLVVACVAAAGGALALAGSDWARALLLIAAAAGFVTALFFWIPLGLALGLAAVLAAPARRLSAAAG